MDGFGYWIECNVCTRGQFYNDNNSDYVLEVIAIESAGHLVQNIPIYLLVTNSYTQQFDF